MDLFRIGEGGYCRYRIPALAVTAEGTVLAFCEGRRHTGRDDDEIDLLLRRSTDGGRTWSDPEVVVSDGDRTCGNPCPVVDGGSGTVWLLFCKDNREVFVTRSQTDGTTWQEPVEITGTARDPAWSYVGTGPGHGIQLRGGRLLAPCWCDESPAAPGADQTSGVVPAPQSRSAGRSLPGDSSPAAPGADQTSGVVPAPQSRSAGRSLPEPPAMGEVQSSFMIYSDDGGATWQRGERLTRDASDEGEVVELMDGSVYATLRSRQGMRCRGFSWSWDQGIRWTKVAYDESLPEPSCQGSIVRYHGEGVVLAHPSERERRARLVVRWSDDGCRTWPAARVVEEGPAAYSDLAVGVDGQILCLYEAGEYERLTLARFAAGWVRGGA